MRSGVFSLFLLLLSSSLFSVCYGEKEKSNIQIEDNLDNTEIELDNQQESEETIQIQASETYRFDSEIGDTTRTLPFRICDYDYIIIGAGTSGSIVATRLSEYANINIAIIDNGKDETDKPSTSTAFFDNPNVEGESLTHYKDLITIPLLSTEPKLAQIQYHQTKNIGGPPEISVGAHGRASAYDHNRIADYLGDKTWDYTNAIPYYKKIENWIGDDPDNIHGKGGPIEIRTFDQDSEINKINKAWSITTDIKEKRDVHDSGGEGIGSMPRNFAFEELTEEGVDGKKNKTIRQTPWRKYLKDRIYNQENENRLYEYKGGKANIHLYSQCTVTEFVLRKNEAEEKWEGERVHMICNGHTQSLFIRKGLIIASGTTSAPIILNRSGVGNCTHLREIGIECKIDLPGVGNNLIDHFSAVTLWIQARKMTADIAKGSMGVMYRKSSPDLPAPDQEFLWNTIRAQVQNASDGSMIPTRFYTISFANLQPKHTGSITLRDADPSTPPKLTFNVLTDESELKIIADALSITRKTMKVFSGEFIEYTPLRHGVPQEFTMQDISQWLTRPGTYIPAMHAIGTTKLGPENDNMAVVGSNMKLYKTANVWVTGVSVLPFAQTTHSMQSTGMYLGELLSDMIIKDQSLVHNENKQ